MQTLCLREERAHVRGRALQAVEHALGLPGDVLDVLREVTLRGGEQVAHAVCERVDRVDAALHGGERVILALDQTGQGVKLRLQAEELFAQLLRGLLGGLRGGAGLTVKAVAPVGDGLSGLAQLLRGGGEGAVGGGKRRLVVPTVHGRLQRLIRLLQGGVRLLQRRVDLAADLADGSCQIPGRGSVAVHGRDEIRNLLREGTVHATARAGVGIRLQRLVQREQQRVRLRQQTLRRADRIVRRQCLRQVACVAEDVSDKHLEIVLGDALLQVRGGGIGDFRRDGVLLVVFVVGDGGLARPLGEHVIHIVCKVLTDHDRGIVVTRADALDGLVLRVDNDPVDAR